MRTGFRFRILVGLLVGGVVLVDGLLLSLLEYNFRLEKHSLILEKQRETAHPQSIEDITDEIRMIATGTLPQATFTDRISAWTQQLDQVLVQDDNIFVGFEVYYPARTLLFKVTDDYKPIRMASWANNLFWPIFRSYYTRTRGIGDDTIAWRIYFTSPRESWEELARKVYLYRLSGAGFLVLSWLAAWGLLVTVINPLKRIAGVLERSDLASPELVVIPQTKVEHAYNNMARGARVAGLAARLAHLPGLTLPLEGEAQETFGEELPDLLKTCMGYAGVAWLIPVGQERLFTVVSVCPSLDWSSSLVPVPSEFPFPSEQPVTSRSHTGWEVFRQKWLPKSTMLMSAGVQAMGELVGMLVVWDCGQAPFHEDEFEFFVRVVQQIEMSLGRNLARGEQMEQDRSQISIDLATNMAHDLTNIIATARTETHTLRMAYDRNLISVADSHRQMLQETFEGLGHTNQLLQEVVDLYRAFGFVRSPRYEPTDLGGLLESTAELYGHSTSRQISVLLEYDETLPTCVLEPRLIRLALFNLLANAAQAVARRRETNPSASNEIVMTARIGVDSHWIELLVRDHGTGFCHPDGTLMTDAQIVRAIASGFTTKEEKRGQGIGLRWVRTIIKDLHNGRLAFSNHTQGGTLVTISLPIHRK